VAPLEEALVNKLLLVLLVVAVAVAWWMRGRRRDRGPAGSDPARRPSAASRTRPSEPAAMLACSHCGVHLPEAEALFDASGRPYCNEAHRLAGPR
jgi:uncharacterized protein